MSESTSERLLLLLLLSLVTLTLAPSPTLQNRHALNTLPSAESCCGMLRKPMVCALPPMLRLRLAPELANNRFDAVIKNSIRTLPVSAETPGSRFFRLYKLAVTSNFTSLFKVQYIYLFQNLSFDCIVT